MLALRWDDSIQGCQLVAQVDGLADDPGLETPVMVSLFTDRRVSEVEASKVPGGDRRGWWAESPTLRIDSEEPVMGSRLWLLRGKPLRASVLPTAEAYADEALAWMLDEGIAGRIVCRALLLSRIRLGLEVTIFRPGDDLEIAYRQLWDVTLNALV